MDILDFSVPFDGYDFPRLCFLVEFLKLPLLLIIIDSSDCSRNHNSQHNCSSFNPGSTSVIRSGSANFDRNRDDTSYYQNPEGEVFESI